MTLEGDFLMLELKIRQIRQLMKIKKRQMRFDHIIVAYERRVCVCVVEEEEEEGEASSSSSWFMSLV